MGLTIGLGLGVANFRVFVDGVGVCDTRRARLASAAELTFACGLVKAHRAGESWRSAELGHAAAPTPRDPLHRLHNRDNA